MAKGESIGVREFARQVGCSHVLILNLIKAGKMPQNDDGSIPLDAGLVAYENRKKKKEPKEKDPKKKKPAPKKRKSTKKIKELPDDDPPEDGEELTDTATKLTSEKLINARDITTQFNKARLAEKTYQAKLREIEYKLKKGELVTRADVEADASAVAAEVRERLSSIPVRISALCEHQPARKIEEVMTDAIQDALISFSKSKFVKAHGDGE
jgi:phage terminase Nu1 subunit (DNA packaging protein)